MKYRLVLLTLISLLITACGATVQQVVPTERPTITPTFTPSPTRTPVRDVTPSTTPSPRPVTPTGGPSPTPLLGPSPTPAPNEPTATRVFNPNAPRIEFFEANALAVAPGETITLYWSVRGASNAVIYRLDQEGNRETLWNVPPAGSQNIRTRRGDRGEVSFILVAGEGNLRVQDGLTIPLRCPIEWFFSPPPDTCPTDEAQPTDIIEQPFERGRMAYVETRNRVYALFNDGRDPAWVAFENRYDPEVHPERDEAFAQAVPPGLYQPLRELGFVWRGNDTVRNRLGLATEPEVAYTGFIQTASSRGGSDILFISSADGSALQLLPDGDVWQIVTSP